jgi:hypothetical protein
VPAFASSTGVEAVELAAMAGLMLDPWQQLVLVNALGERSDGRWAAFEVGVNVARQNGKGGILEGRELAGLFLVGEQLIIHSAHQFDTSMEAFLRMDALLEGCPELSRRVRSVSRSHGSEGFSLFSGQRLRYRTRTRGGGRGFSCDCLVLDEAMILSEAAHGALLPTLSARENPQVWYTGSAVDQLVHEHGLVFARVRERGLRGDTEGLAYFEWSVDHANPETADDLAVDERAWSLANPGLGIRIDRAHIDKERRSLSVRGFAVERLGIGDWPVTDGSAGAVIDVHRWDALTDSVSRPTDRVALAFDVSPDRSTAAIGLVGARDDGLAHLEVLEHRNGTGWLPARLIELADELDPVAVICDGAGPAGSLVDELEKAGVKVTVISAKEHAHACGLLFDGVEQQTVRHLGGAELRAAVRGAAQRPLGDAWAWSRKTSATDISPLVAVTLAVWGLETAAERGEPAFAWA